MGLPPHQPLHPYRVGLSGPLINGTPLWDPTDEMGKDELGTSPNMYAMLQDSDLQ